MLGDEIITSEDVNNTELIKEWIMDSGIVSELGVPYPLYLRIYVKGGRMYLDEVMDAPWQVGGNSGQVRALRLLSEAEYYELVRDKK